MTIAGFEPTEFEQRCARAQAQMVEQGLDALLLTTEADVRYFTGFLTRFWESPTRPWFVILPPFGKPVAVIPSAGEALMATCWVSEIRTWPAPDLNDDGVSLLAGTLQELVGERGRIGLPMGHETHLRMPLGDFFRLQDMLGPRSWVDATPITRGLQMVKSDAEIAIIERACGIGGLAFEGIAERLEPGVPLSTVFRDFQRLLLAAGADWVPYLAGGAGPFGYHDVISPASDRPLAAGDVIMLDTGAVVSGYFCDFDRNWAIGAPSARLQDAYRVLVDATDAGLAAATIGAEAADVFHAMAKVITKFADPGAVGRLGHGLGMRLTEWPSLIAEDHTLLEAGMVITLEPAVMVGPSTMLVLEENIAIEVDGPRLLTPRAPSSLPILRAY